MRLCRLPDVDDGLFRIDYCMALTKETNEDPTRLKPSKACSKSKSTNPAVILLISKSSMCSFVSSSVVAAFDDNVTVRVYIPPS